MTFIKKKDLETLQQVRTVLEGKRAGMTASETRTLEEFCSLLDSIETENETIKKRTRENMRKYRSTPEGKEKDRIRQQKASRNYYQKKKAQKVSTEPTE